MDMSSLSTIGALCDLLKPEDQDSDSDEDKPTSSMGRLGPGNIGNTTSNTTSKSSQNTHKNKSTNSKDIWDEDEIPDGAEYESTYDPRPQPEYEILYKQAVTPEDMFLQMGNKTNATSSCEDMVIIIKLPDTKMVDVDLDVKPKFLDCRSPKYKLGLHLPHPVDDKNGKAEWDKTKETLKVTLTMRREYDFVNM